MAKVTTTGELPDLPLGRESPLELVRTVFASFFQGLFHASPPGAYHFEPHEETEIVICDESPVHTEQLGVRPAIAVARGPVRFHSLGIDDLLAYDPQTGTKTKSVLCGGAMLVHGISRVLLESERLAWICAEQLWAHRELLLREGMFELGRRPEIGAPSPPGALLAGDGADEYVVTTVTCPFQFYRTTRVSPLGTRIVRGIGADLRARLARAGSVGPADAGGPELPVGTRTCPPPPWSPASDARGHSAAPGRAAPLPVVAPHPLDPTRLVRVRVVRPFRHASRDPGTQGALPISEGCEPESPPVATSRVKT
jgi:hypothetical protein